MATIFCLTVEGAAWVLTPSEVLCTLQNTVSNFWRHKCQVHMHACSMTKKAQQFLSFFNSFFIWSSLECDTGVFKVHLFCAIAYLPDTPLRLDQRRPITNTCWCCLTLPPQQSCLSTKPALCWGYFTRWLVLNRQKCSWPHLSNNSTPHLFSLFVYWDHPSVYIFPDQYKD